MIQFSRPKKSLASALDPFKRHESSANEYIEKGRVPGPAPSRFDPSYYRTHDSLAGFIPADAQSVVSQAVSAFPLMPKGKYPGYASSVVSQQPDGMSVAPSIAFSQFDRLPAGMGMDGGKPGLGGIGGIGAPRRRLSFSSVAPSDAPTASMYAFGYKAGDDDTQSIAPSQAGMTEF
jgi:regulator of nonsense transcripts 1